MSDKRRATLLEDLSVEIVVDQILIRLPSKDVGRCGAVSPSWRSATSTPQFMLEHRPRQPLLPIIDGQGQPTSYAIYRDASAGASTEQLWPSLPGPNFLIVYHGTRLYICNPVIRTHAVLPLPYYGQDFMNIVIGFYRHHPTDDYRVLFVSESKNYPRYNLHNLTVGPNESRHVAVTMPAVSSPYAEQKLLEGLRHLDHCLPPVQHGGSLHWCPYGDSYITEGGGDIIAFNTEVESFRWMRNPAQLLYNWNLFNMKGTLAFWGGSTPDFTAINVWVMQDYEAEIWAFKYRIDLSTVESSRRLYRTSLKKKRKKENTA